MRLRVLVVCVLLISLAGCDGRGQTSVPVSIENVSTESTDDAIEFTGELVVLQQYQGEFEIEDTRVVFTNSSGTTMQAVEIGRIPNSSFREGFTVKLNTPPERIAIRVGEVHTDVDVELYGKRRTDSGTYESFLQE